MSALPQPLKLPSCLFNIMQKVWFSTKKGKGKHDSSDKWQRGQRKRRRSGRSCRGRVVITCHKYISSYMEMQGKPFWSSWSCSREQHRQGMAMTLSCSWTLVLPKNHSICRRSDALLSASNGFLLWGHRSCMFSPCCVPNKIPKCRGSTVSYSVCLCVLFPRSATDSVGNNAHIKPDMSLPMAFHSSFTLCLGK